MKGIMRFDKKGKLAPRYVGPFEIIDRVGEVAYHLALPPEFSHVHPVFHISMLRKYIPDPSHVLSPQSIELTDTNRDCGLSSTTTLFQDHTYGQSQVAK